MPLSEHPPATETIFDTEDKTFALVALPPFLRVLMTTDGTVTKSLQAYFWENIEVHTLHQSECCLDKPYPGLCASAGEILIERHVALRGRESDRCYANARSLIRRALLPPHLMRELARQRIGVGELLRDCGLETYREILAMGGGANTDEVWRRYCIRMGQAPFIEITETFPLALFVAQEPSRE